MEEGRGYSDLCDLKFKLNCGVFRFCLRAVIILVIFCKKQKERKKNNIFVFVVRLWLSYCTNYNERCVGKVAVAVAVAAFVVVAPMLSSVSDFNNSSSTSHVKLDFNFFLACRT